MGKSKLLLILCIVAVLMFLPTCIFYGVEPLLHPSERYVGAYYYCWYNDNYWQIYGKNLEAYPSLGLYSSDDPQVLLQHLRWAEASGIDFFAISWWNNHVDKNVALLFSVARQSAVKLCIVIEAYTDVVKDTQQLQQFADYIYMQYASQPCYFQLYGKPLLLIYDPSGSYVNWNDERFTVRNISFHTPYLSEAGRNWQAYVGDFVTVFPGYNDTGLVGINRVNATVIPRENGEFYRRQWESAVLLSQTMRHKTLIALITTFNEIPEQTFIEPSPEWDNLYLEITAQYSVKFKNP